MYLLNIDYAWKIIKETAVTVVYNDQELTEKREVSKNNLSEYVVPIHLHLHCLNRLKSIFVLA